MMSAKYTIIIVLLSHLTNVLTEFDVSLHPNAYLLPKKCGSGSMDRIIGGTRAVLGQYPWLARIGYGVSECSKNILYRCGGFLISEWYVSTAAHCVTDLPSIVCPRDNRTANFKLASIVLGEHVVDTNIDCEDGECADPIQDFGPGQVHFHESYNDPKYAHDIGLIRLDRRAKITPWVQPICLRRKKLSWDFVGEYGEVAGWGTYDLKRPNSSNELLFVKVPLLPIANCKAAYKKDFDMNSVRQLCAGGIEGKDSCGGDSGGPLMYAHAEDGPPRYYGIGVVSFGAKKCGEVDKPAIYSKIGHYMEWILNHLKP